MMGRLRLRRRPRRRAQAGLTLMEVLIATAILATMMMLTWRTVSGTSTTRRTFEASEERNHELRMALGRVVADFEAAYLSKNEDQTASHPRSMMIARPTGKAPEIRFSTMGHRVLWADANESELTVVQYLTRTDPQNQNATDWVRRELRRPSNEVFEDQPAEYDVLVHDIKNVKIELWNWKSFEWQDTWDTTQADGQKNWLPSRVRITITVEGPNKQDYKVQSQARILMQEPLNFVQSN